MTLRAGSAKTSVALSVGIVMMAVACRGKDAVVPEDRTDSAVQEVLDAWVWRSERGKLQLDLDAPIIRKYDHPRPKTVYLGNESRRVLIRFYNEELKVRSSIEADSAFSLDESNIMEAHGNVVVIDYSQNDTIYLADLIWNSAEDRIYSEHPVLAKNGSRITEGDGFESDQHMEHMHVVRQRGTIEIED
ncbi:MAG: LPS export ABC transporter periplasmic protein LptC [Bacteroidales bacterium]|nr:LPS export ABC transporter periplasmic protein LptC [Bacteroidales bacterium]